MNGTFSIWWAASIAAVLPVAIGAAPCPAEVSRNILENGSFEGAITEAGVPAGWSLYGGQSESRRIEAVDSDGDGGRFLLIEDGDPAAEIGIVQTRPAKPGLTYEASVEVRPVKGASSFGAYLQMRFAPSDKFVQTDLVGGGLAGSERVSVKATAPPDTKSVRVYLYTHRGPTPKVLLRDVRLVSGVKPPPPPLPPAPKPVPPAYDKLKDLHLTTALVAGGRANVTIIAPASGLYRELADEVRAAVEKLTGVAIPVADDGSPAGACPPAAARPPKMHLIALGNRSTNATIGLLYDRYYTLLDLRYPGPAGYVVRTLHNPFGNGRNVIFLGGSDDAGVGAATEAFIKLLGSAERGAGELSVGRLAEIKLGNGARPPTELSKFRTWEASAGYRSSGYFGWNSISKRMAMYYMTGDEFQAKEFLRLALPDAETKKEIARTDGEMLENKDDPLAGPYHYNAHMMVLYWDLIEESPVFSDEDRLRVTNAFARQLDHRKSEGIYGRTRPGASVSSRHGQWSAISLYCLGRYFNKDYPDPIWSHCVEAATLHFKPLHSHAWVYGESDNLYWYSTGIAPIFTYLTLTGDRKPVENGVLGWLLRGQEVLATGRKRDWGLRYASMGYLHKAAYLTGDGRYIHYRDRTGVDTEVFRLGQSYWPASDLAPVPPRDLVGEWQVHSLPRPMWRARGSGLPPETSFQFASFRTTTDGSGDFILLDGYNGASRNPYHTFSILELRLAGRPLLQGYRNQLLTRVDGLVEPRTAMDAALNYREVIGPTVLAVGEVPGAAYCNWRRTIAQRTGRYALIVDDLTLRADTDNLEVQVLWETSKPAGTGDAGRVSVPLERRSAPGRMWLGALDNKVSSNLTGPDAVKRLESLDIVLLRATEPGGYLDVSFNLDEAVNGKIVAHFLNYVDRGVVRIRLDGEEVGGPFDHYAPNVEAVELSLGKRRLAAGPHTLRLQVVDKNPVTGRCFVGFSGLAIATDDAPRFDNCVICMSDPASVRRRGKVATMQWMGPAAKGAHQVFFSIVGVEPGTSTTPLGCFRLTDRAAALALPSPAMAVVGESNGMAGELVVLAQDHLFAKAVEKVSIPDGGSPLLSADAPVDVDWDFTTGVLHVNSTTRVRVRPAGRKVLDLSPGKHAIEGAKLDPGPRAELTARLSAALDQARRVRAQSTAAIASKAPAAELPSLSTTMSANVGGRVTDLVTVPTEEGELIYVAEGNAVHVLTTDGQELRKLEADGPIRVLRWWAEHNLLLVGCADEKVIAFDAAGQRKWTFVSEMDPAVFRAAKTYWFKSAPGHEGIHGLHTGVFMNGESQAFVGSACTLEIIDQKGKLIERMPQFWGKVSHFAIIDGPDGSLNLLAARKYNGTNRVGIINNKTLDPKPRGFHTVPSGTTYVGGWSSMNRHHLFYEDLDGDGVREVIGEINGTWNRVTVWRADGQALCDASFGPGEKIMARNMRDLDVADLDADGKKEIVAATSSGLIVALDGRCRKLWATRLRHVPTVLKCVFPHAGRPAWIAIGCEGGGIVVLDARGKPIRSGKITGQPTHIDVIPGSNGPVVLFATDKGAVRCFGGGGR